VRSDGRLTGVTDLDRLVPPSSPLGLPAQQSAERILFELKKVVVGQQRVLERLVTCLIANGHALLEGVPGVAKTLMCSTLARSVGGSFNRIQFTPDLLPSDVVGTRIFRSSSEQFDVELGPIFANIVLADEINRAPAKVQSALLEVMAERQVTIGGTTHPVPNPLLVLATQNPIENEGTYPLPEAQRDRFLMRIEVGYPSLAEEMEIVHRMSVNPPAPEQVLSLPEVLTLQQAAKQVQVVPEVADYAVRLVMATRNPAAANLMPLAGQIAVGCSPRASLGLVAAGRALALLRGKTYCTPQEIFDVAPEVLPHRLVLTYEALADGVRPMDVVNTLISNIYAPVVSFAVN
jgi:MoxR-like ATPase